jgi:hypothetical protein
MEAVWNSARPQLDHGGLSNFRQCMDRDDGIVNVMNTVVRSAGTIRAGLGARPRIPGALDALNSGRKWGYQLVRLETVGGRGAGVGAHGDHVWMGPSRR